MSNTFWIVSLNTDQYQETLSSNFKTQAFLDSDIRKVERMEVGDKIIYYINDCDTFSGVVEINSAYKKNDNSNLEVSIRKELILDDGQGVEGNQIGPSLEYVKRWAPERWKLSMVGMLHIISQNDFNLIKSCLIADRSKINSRGKRKIK